jgi:ribosomal 50S subunit-recycling heat shock protein
MKKSIALICSGILLISSGAYAVTPADDIVNIQKQGKEIKVTGMNNTRTIKCTGDEIISIEGASNKITIVGSFAKLNVEGASNNVKAENVLKIEVEGTQNMINVNKVDAVSVEGAHNHVHYKSSANKSGKADVSIEGADNMVMKMK